MRAAPQSGARLHRRPPSGGLVALGLALLLAACAGTPAGAPANPRLEEARAEVRALSADSEVGAYAGPEVRMAVDALGSAEQAAGLGASAEEIEHLSHVAGRRAAIARATAEIRRANLAAANATESLDRLRDARGIPRPPPPPPKPAAAPAAPSPGAAVATAPATAAAAAPAVVDWKALGASVDARGPHLLLADAAFAGRQGRLSAAGERQLKRLAALLQAQPQRRAVVRSLSSGRKADAALAGARVGSVRAALIAQGIKGMRLASPPSGGKPPTRRGAPAVEILLSDENGTFATRR